MSILIFIIILGVLILVHELGHFFVAKAFGIRVDEFGFGYPPKALTFFRWKGTDFTLNWLPFGGFVKIFGENGETDDSVNAINADQDKNTNKKVLTEKSFVQKPRYAQALVLIAGVSFNIIFAWLLISVGFVIGLPTSSNSTIGSGRVDNPKLVITTVTPDSPALNGGLKSGDIITGVEAIGPNPTVIAGSVSELSPESVSEFIAKHGENDIKVSYTRKEEKLETKITPGPGIIEGRKAIGISMDMIGILSLPVHEALWEGARTTVSLTKMVAVGLGKFVYDTVRGASDFSQVTGPVGIVGLVGDASKLGFIYLISFTAFISINLAVINLVPFPALDGGRLLFVAIESIKRSPIPAKYSNILNTVGFLLLIGMMILVTIHDVVKLF